MPTKLRFIIAYLCISCFPILYVYDYKQFNEYFIGCISAQMAKNNWLHVYHMMIAR